MADTVLFQQAPHRPAVLAEQACGLGDIAGAALAQAGYSDAHCREPKEKVLAEGAIGHHLVEIGICGGDDMLVGPFETAIAEAAEGVVLGDVGGSP